MTAPKPCSNCDGAGVVVRHTWGCPAFKGDVCRCAGVEEPCQECFNKEQPEPRGEADKWLSDGMEAIEK